MRLYEIMMVDGRTFGLMKTERQYYITIPNEEVRHQFALDEEKRSGKTVYIRPVVGETVDLVYFTKVACDVPDDEIHELSIYKKREVVSEQLN